MDPNEQLRRVVALHRAGRLAEAERGYRSLLAARPGHPQLNHLLGTLLQDRGEAAAARDHHARAVAGDPNLGAAWFGLGLCHQELGDLRAAATAFERAASLRPDDVMARVAHGLVLRDLGQADAAVARLQQALALNPDNPGIRLNLGDTCRFAGDLEAARAHYDAVLAAQPGAVPALTRKAGLLEQLGDAEGAHALIADLLDAPAPPPDAVLAFAMIARRLGRAAEGVERVERLLASGEQAGDRIRLHFQAAHLLDHLGEHDRAFTHYRQGNQAMRVPFDRDRYRAASDRVMAVFSRAAMATLPRATVRSALPLFIVGMPRSGTSLTEQILACHPAVAGGGELPDMNRVVTAAARDGRPYPDSVPGLPPSALDALAESYLDTLRRIGPGAGRVTDKMPTNFRHLGMIALLFPGAPVVHCTRHPLDTCLSIYFQMFARGGHPYAADLADIGCVFRDYRRMMAHWRAVLDAEPLAFPYEETVADQEGQSRRLLAFAGLPWDDACLAFHKSGRKVVTASYDQVRRPIYGRSVARWRRYERHLGPLIAALGPDADLD